MKTKSLINLILIILNCNNLYSKFYYLNSKNKIDYIVKKLPKLDIKTDIL